MAWSRRFSCCQQCGTSALAHHSGGLCKKCHSNLSSIRYYDAVVERVLRWQAEHPEKHRLYCQRSKQRARYGFALGDTVMVPIIGRAVCVGSPRRVKGERLCDLQLQRTREVIETPVAGIVRAG